MKKKFATYTLLILGLVSSLKSWSGDCHLDYRPGAVPVNYLSSLKSAGDYQRLLKNEGTNTYVKFTIDLKKKELPIYFQNTNQFDYHYPFLSTQIAEFKNFSSTAYESFIFSGPMKRLTAGAVYYSPCFKNVNSNKLGIVGINIYFKAEVDIKEVVGTFKRLKKGISFAKDRLAFVFERKEDYFKYKKKLDELKIPSILLSSLVAPTQAPIVYHAAVSYGYLRNFSASEMESGEYNAKDILILEKTPLDIGPLSGVITTAPQAPHSHVILRSINQNIPNVFIPTILNDPKIKLYFNQLVEFRVNENGEWSLLGADKLGEKKLQKLAFDYFSNRVPKLPALSANLSKKNLFSLGNTLAKSDLVQSFGAKGANFAILDQALRQANIDRSYFDGAHLIPFFYYAAHLKEALSESICQNTYRKCRLEEGLSCDFSKDLCLKIAGDSHNHNTLKDFLKEISSRENTNQMLSHSEFRRSALLYTRSLIENTPFDQANLDFLRARMEKNFKKNQRIRLRSSTNAEDLPGLNGAGFYDSKSVCLADDIVGNENVEASACLTETEKNRINAIIVKLKNLDPVKYAKIIEKYKNNLTQKYPLEKAIKKVYASIWNDRAFLYRDYYKLDHLQVYMGLLVHPAFIDEKANGVAFVSKDKNTKSLSINVVAQIDDISVTNPELPFAIADHFLFTKNEDGNFVGPRFDLRSNLTTNGASVLTEEQSKSLLVQLAFVHRAMEKNYGVSRTEIYDAEFILSSKGEIQIKQIRPLGKSDEIAPVEPVNKQTGEYVFTYHNHQWNNINIFLEDSQMAFSTPQGDAENPRRNITFGFRPFMTFNQFSMNNNESQAFRWPDQFPDNKKRGEIFCKAISTLIDPKETNKEYQLKDFIPFFLESLGKLQIAETDICPLPISRPIVIDVFNNYENYSKDLICMVSPEKEWGQGHKFIALYMPFAKTTTAHGPYMKEWPLEKIQLCIDGKKIEIKEKK